ncbi:dual serine/threonine and tyrosine protein kinase-like [Dendronephthya gigantea]|uniref:dual serine/threonine and tyrosine protein kinase-like n=1 Tax=Dendronephthya gigantea TaxID=151771 RepID=UPI00106B9616|nr:dual serine/threonine and tyrosine protein kinase-like [Dendronephthya gigantea]
MDVSKRTELLSLYEKVEDALKSCDEKMQKSLNTKFSVENIVDEIQLKMNKLQVKEYVVLIAGETSSGKSSFINLILGEDILPSSTLPATSTICELRYGEVRKIVAYYKDEQRQPEELILRDPVEGQSYPDQLREYLDQSDDREKGPRFKKCKLFWPHDLLKNEIVIVDSPGIGESNVLDDVVNDYLLTAFCFVYVIDSSHAGGVQKDRILKLLERVKDQSLECFLCERAVFVCNKWDVIERKGSDEESAVKKYTIDRLKKTWPNLNAKTQVVQMSTTNAVVARKFGVKSEQFVSVMDAIKTMMLKTIAARLKAEWRWLNDVLSRLIFQTKLLINRAQKEDLKATVAKAIMKLAMIEQKHVESIESLKKRFKNETNKTVDQLSLHLSSDVFKSNLQSWDEDQCPEMENTWEETERKIVIAIGQRFVEEVAKWEIEHRLIENTRKLLLDQITKQRNLLHVRIQGVENYVSKEPATVNNPEVATSFTITEKFLIGALSPIWFPLALVASVISLPILGVMALKDAIQTAGNKKGYKSNKANYLAKQAEEYRRSCIAENIFRSFVLNQFKEISINIEKMEREIPAIIRADKLIICALIEESMTVLRDAEKYAPIFAKCSDTKGELSIFAINDVLLSDVDFDDLECDLKSSLGHGSFADVFEGKMISEGKGSLNVAVKVCKEVLTTQNASMLLEEEQMLRKLNHPNVVKFYGRALRPGKNGLKFVFVMELCAESLRDYFTKHPKCFPARAPENISEVIQSLLQRGKDIAVGLDYLHHQGIVHRDLKPENILFGKDNCMKIADVGISKNITEVTGTIAGTPLYMAPEIFAAEICDASADIYSFGLILWEMWYGEVVYSELHNLPLRTFSERISNNYRPKIKTEAGTVTIPEYVSLIRNCWPTEQLERLPADQCVAKLDAILVRHTT